MAKKKKKSKKKSSKKKGASKAKKSQAAKKKQAQKAKKPSVDFFEQTLGQRSVYLVLGLLALVATFVYGSFWFTDNVFLFKDIGSDTINVFYPNYYWNAENWAEEGVFSAWSFSSGVGQNILAGSVGDPFLWLLYLGGKDSIIHLLGYIEALKIILAGLAFYAYLRTMKMNHLAAIVGGLFYAFSGFMMIGSGWYVFSIEGLYFALLLLAFERFLMQGKWGLFPIVIMLVAMLQPVDVYMMAVLIATYGTVRILDHNNLDWKDLGIKYLQLAGLGALGLAMGAVLVFPTLDQMVNSPRVLGESSFFDTLKSKSAFAMASNDLWATTKARLLATDLLKDENNIFRGAMNYLEAPAIYAGLATLLLAPQAFSFMKKQGKILFGILLGVYLLPLLFPFLRYSFWLFTGDYYRIYSLFVIFILLYLASKTIHETYEQKRISWIGLGVGVVLSFYLLFSIGESQLVVVNSGTQNYLLFLVLLHAGLIALWSVDGLRRIARIAFLLLVVVELISTATPVQNDRRMAKATEFETEKVGYNDYTRDAVQWIKSVDPSFHRIEKNYASYNKQLILHTSTNDAKVQGYYGTKSYHSFNHLNYVRFLGAVDIINEKDENQTRWIPGVGMRPMINFLLSNKYFLSKQGPDKGVGFGYQHKNTVGNVSIFENPNFLPFGFTYDKVLLRSDFDQLDKKLVQNVYGAKDIALLKAGVIEDADAATVNLPKLDLQKTNPQAYPMQQMVTDINQLKQETFEMEHFQNNRFRGQITISDSPKLLFFSMPFDKGWTAYVDGQAVEKYQTNVGFTGLLLEPGQHKVEMVYQTPYFYLGLIVSLIALAIYGGLWWWLKQRAS